MILTEANMFPAQELDLCAFYGWFEYIPCYFNNDRLSIASTHKIVLGKEEWQMTKCKFAKVRKLYDISNKFLQQFVVSSHILHHWWPDSTIH